MIPAQRVCCLTLLSLVSLCLHAQDHCPARPSFDTHVRRYTGAYENFAYGFSTRIPSGLTGIDEDDPEYQRGFTIVSPRTAGTLSVTAEVNSADLASALQAAKQEAAYLRKDAEQMEELTFAETTLGSRPAVRLSARFRCNGKSGDFSTTRVFALGSGKRFIYRITWEGPAANASATLRNLDALVSSWKFIPAR